jgi:hypothetical protein
MVNGLISSGWLNVPRSGMIRHYSKQGCTAATNEVGTLVEYDGGVEHTVTKETETA